jgi:transcription antitermination factor NusG
MKFKIGDWVILRKGPFLGMEAEVTDIYENRYGINIPFLADDDEMELRGTVIRSKNEDNS